MLTYHERTTFIDIYGQCMQWVHAVRACTAWTGHENRLRYVHALAMRTDKGTEKCTFFYSKFLQDWQLTVAMHVPTYQ